jgi:hypothetical protein
MMGVVFDPEKLEKPEEKAWWEEWQTRARRATDKAIDHFEGWLSGPRDEPFKFDFRSEIWSDLKNWLNEHVFCNKCGYCETQILRFFGDAEHYRPKGGVQFRDDDGDIVTASCQTVDPNSELLISFRHPGYFWLAYDWRNLVPACQLCNSGTGKNQRFDTQNGHFLLTKLDGAELLAMPAEVRPKASRWPGYYYPSPAMLDKLEEPFLLFPLNPAAGRNPRDFLNFGTRGLVTPLTGNTMAERTVEVFGLDDEPLRLARQTAQETFFRTYKDKLGEVTPETGFAKANQFLDLYASGKPPYSAAILGYYKSIYDEIPKPR